MSANSYLSSIRERPGRNSIEVFSTCSQSKDVDKSLYLQNVADVARWSEEAGCKGILVYGPTEATVASSYYTVPACPPRDDSPIPIGTPCDGEELLVLDDNLRPAPPGEVGALFIGGVGLSPGYWRDEQKTSEVFLDTASYGRIYKTGDLAKVGEDGMVYFLGRADSQIKSRGYRIELGEIETALNALGLLRECAVVAVNSEGFEGTAICCAYAPLPCAGGNPTTLRQALRRTLPSYMLPSHWICFERLPQNGNGKIDRRALQEQFQQSLSQTAQA